MKALTPYLMVGIGGFFGANARLLASSAAQRLFGTGFPYGTFLINVSGSFFLGVILTMIAQKTVPWGEEIRLAIAVGFLGAFTTFSTFEFENSSLLGDGEWLLAALNMFGSLVLGLLAVRLGIALARQWP